MNGDRAGTVLARDAGLEIYLAALDEFQTAVVEELTDGQDFTIRLEVRGNKRELLHVRVSRDHIGRPSGVEKRIQRG